MSVTDPHSLDEWGIRFNTDKASTAVREGRRGPTHDVLRHYEAAVAALPKAPRLILDLGVGRPPNEFASASMWAGYLPEARVLAVDVMTPTVETPQRVEFIKGDLGNIETLTALARAYAPDIVIDDASHLWGHQLTSLFYLLPAVAPGGLFILEDMHVSGDTLAGQFGQGLRTSPMDFLVALARELVLEQNARRRDRMMGRPARKPRYNGGSDAADEVMVSVLAPIVDSITFVGEAAILRRRTS